MTTRQGICLLAGCLAPFVLASALAAYREGPPPAHTGGFAEDTCQACHFDNDVNEALGSLMLEGVPAVFAPGQQYRLTVSLARPGMAAAGFQLAVRVAEGPARSRQAGALRAVDERVQVTHNAETGIFYAQHTETGAAASDSAAWVVDWTPGPGSSPVAFHVAANAANDDASEFGDFIYTGDAVSVRASPESRRSCAITMVR